MMISPEMYVEEFEDKPFEELIEERRKLEKEIEELETIVFDKEKKSKEWCFSPSPDARYQIELEYLSAFADFMRERFDREYERGH